MDWLTIAQLIIAVGIPAAEKIVALWESKTPVSTAEFQNLRTLTDQRAQDRMKAALVAAGIPLGDPKALALLAAAGLG